MTTTAITTSPHNLEAEQLLLGAIMLDGAAIHQVLPGLSLQDFFNGAHGKIFAAMCALHSRNIPIEYIAVAERLRADGDLDDVGGKTYLAQLVGNSVTSILVDQHAAVIKNLAALRDVIRMAREVLEAAESTAAQDAGDFIATLPERLSEIKIAGSDNFHNTQDLVARCDARTRDAWEHGVGRLTGVPTGIDALDRMTGGWQAPDLIIFGGRPGMGKTGALCSAALAAASAGFPAAILSLEMSAEQITFRKIASISRVWLTQILMGKLSKSEWQLVSDAQAKLSTLPLVISEPRRLLSAVLSDIHTAVVRHKARLVCIDYLQMINLDNAYTGKRGLNRAQELAEIGGALKEAAKKYRIPIIAGAQVNRESENGQRRRPEIHDLRDSGAIEQDADIIIMLYRDGYYERDMEQHGAEYIVAKGRNYGNDTISVLYSPKFQIFENLPRETMQG